LANFSLTQPLSNGIHQKDSSNKCSYITVGFDNNYLPDELSIDAIGPKFFKRNLRIFVLEKNIQQPKIHSIISSDIERTYIVDEKTKMLRIEIDNDDNPALRITNVYGYQLRKYLPIWHLEKNIIYCLVTALLPLQFTIFAFLMTVLKRM